MTKVFLTLALTLSTSTSFAALPGVGYGGTTGALALETRDLATNANEVRRQGGFVTAGAVHWIQPQDEGRKMSAVAY